MQCLFLFPMQIAGSSVGDSGLIGLAQINKTIVHCVQKRRLKCGLIKSYIQPYIIARCLKIKAGIMRKQSTRPRVDMNSKVNWSHHPLTICFRFNRRNFLLNVLFLKAFKLGTGRRDTNRLRLAALALFHHRAIIMAFGMEPPVYDHYQEANS